ncbi:MAG TPA: ELWxxDGT repeat protein [Thermoanaerobaculia bacterium]|nr:ELWxxDGT repeat protein [Thermoanaerobaculia bacterium]
MKLVRRSQGVLPGWLRWAIAGFSFCCAAASGQQPYLVKDIEPTNVKFPSPCFFGQLQPPLLLSGSFPTQLTELAGRLYFVADDLVHGLELWTSDGTAAGTVMVADLCPGKCGSDPEILGRYRNALLFLANDPAGGRSLYKVEAATQVPTLLREVCSGCASSGIECAPLVPHASAQMGGAFFFIAPSAAGEALWRTDGTALATVVLDTVCTGPLCGASPTPLAASAGSLFLLAREGAGGALWRSDGTPAGSSWLATVCPAPQYAQFSAFTKVNQRVFFDVTCGYNIYLVPRFTRAWVSDGTAQGTHPLFSGEAGTEDGVSGLTAAGDRAFFSLSPPSSSGPPPAAELWSTDGTAAGTARVAAATFRDPRPVAALDQALIFTASDLAGKSGLWRLDLGSGAASFITDETVVPSVLDGVLLFEGTGLWRSDGSAAGTSRIPLAAWDLREFTAAGGRVFFQATDTTHGTELWATDRGALTGVTCIADETTQCLADSRFAVSVRFQDPFGSGARLAGHSFRTPLESGTGDRSGRFWFFSPDDVELIVKILDGRSLNQSFWVFYGALSDVEYWLTVTDTRTGVAKTYHNPAGTYCGRGDASAFPVRAEASPAAAPSPRLPEQGGVAARRAAVGVAAADGPCVSGPQALCLHGGRLRAEVTWRTPSNGGAGAGYAVPSGDELGFFWFWSAGNLELAVKVLDATSVNGHFWLFYGALTDVEYTLTVTDSRTGQVRIYHNPAGNLCGGADTAAF